MLVNNDLFIELDSCQRVSQVVSTDIYRQQRFDDYVVSVMFSGNGGTPIQRNIDATIICSAAMKHISNYRDIDRVASSLVSIICSSGKPQQQLVGFTIVKADNKANVDIVTYRMPNPIFLSGNGAPKSFVGERLYVELPDGSDYYKRYSFRADIEDRVVFLSTLSVEATATEYDQIDTEFWSETKSIIQHLVDESPRCSATELARKIILDSYNYEGDFTISGDQSCGVVYFRRPRKLLLCTGPPYNDEKDKYLASRVESYDGSIVICGGTTAGIVSRELNREISVLLGRDPSGLPNASDMDGVTMITEGVLTLGRVKDLLESLQEPVVKGRGIDIRLTRLLLNHDLVEFIVGTRVNSQHHDPSIPVELELRRNVIKEVSSLLNKRFFKEVWVKYI